YFHKGTVNLIGIDTVFKQDCCYIAMKFQGHYFVGENNGIFSIKLNGEQADELIEIEMMQDLRFLHFPLADVLAKVACHIAKGDDIKLLGSHIDQPLHKGTLQPTIDNSIIKGRVSCSNSLANVHTKIRKKLFNKT